MGGFALIFIKFFIQFSLIMVLFILIFDWFMYIYGVEKYQPLFSMSIFLANVTHFNILLVSTHDLHK